VKVVHAANIRAQIRYNGSNQDITTIRGRVSIYSFSVDMIGSEALSAELSWYTITDFFTTCGRS